MVQFLRLVPAWVRPISRFAGVQDRPGSEFLKTVRIDCRGQLNPMTDAKDLSLWLCRELTIAGASYDAIEYHGLDWLPLNEKQNDFQHGHRVGSQGRHLSGD